MEEFFRYPPPPTEDPKDIFGKSFQENDILKQLNF
jgi:hypothetical protein